MSMSTPPPPQESCSKDDDATPVKQPGEKNFVKKSAVKEQAKLKDPMNGRKWVKKLGAKFKMRTLMRSGPLLPGQFPEPPRDDFIHANVPCVMDELGCWVFIKGPGKAD